MNYRIVHDMPGRIRIRCGQYAFSLKESYGIECVLNKSGYVKDAKASHITGSILIHYEEEFRNKILNLISKLKVDQLPAITDIYMDDSKEIELRFKNKIINMIGIRYLIKLFVPLGVRNFILLLKSAKFIGKGLRSLTHMRINVDVLDAASIGAAIIQKV